MPIGARVTIREDTYDGYYPLFSEGPVTLAGGGECTIDMEDTPRRVTVTNTSGYELPHTGGRGKWMFVLGGITLMVAAIAIYFSSRRKSERRYL